VSARNFEDHWSSLALELGSSARATLIRASPRTTHIAAGSANTPVDHLYRKHRLQSDTFLELTQAELMSHDTLHRPECFLRTESDHMRFLREERAKQRQLEHERDTLGNAVRAIFDPLLHLFDHLPAPRNAANAGEAGSVGAPQRTQSAEDMLGPGDDTAALLFQRTVSADMVLARPARVEPARENRFARVRTRTDSMRVKATKSLTSF